MMSQKIVEWLLEEDNPSVRYYTLTEWITYKALRVLTFFDSDSGKKVLNGEQSH